MITYLLLVSALCLSIGCCIVYRMSTGVRVTVTGTTPQDKATFLAAKRARSNKPVAELHPQAPRRHQEQLSSTARQSINTLTSEALDALYAERDRLREQLDEAHHRHCSHDSRQDALTARHRAAGSADDLVAAHLEHAAELRAQLTGLEAKRVGVYRERAHLLVWLAILHHRNAFLTAATDVDEPGWKRLYINVAGHKLSWHIAPRDLELFDHVMTVPTTDPRVQGDGHTTDEKYQRLRSLTFSEMSTAVRTPAPPARARDSKAAPTPATGHSSTPAMATQRNVDALLDAYALRGRVIQQALRLVNAVIDAPFANAAEQRLIHDFAHKIRHALVVASAKTDT